MFSANGHENFQPASPEREIASPSQGAGPSVPGITSAPPADADELVRWLGEAFATVAPSGVAPFARVRVAEGATLIHEGAPLRHLFLVQAGWLKRVVTGEDGYEQVVDFTSRQALLGTDALANGRHRRGVVALEDSWVYALPWHDVYPLFQRMPAFAARWHAALAREILRADETAWTMAAVGAEKRTARFVLLLARRMAELGESRSRLHLHMGRRDIGSHLGLAHESVSRALTTLADAGMLRVENREVEILDALALSRFALSTRGYPQAAPRPQPAKRPTRTAASRATHSTAGTRMGSWLMPGWSPAR
jgi:CRP/FNR family transcriptional regulator